MKKVLIAYFSTSGKTEEMAEYIAEGVRFNGLQAIVKAITEINKSEDIVRYEGFILGSPTVSLEIPNPVKTFLDTLKEVYLEGKLAGAFGPYSHDVSYQRNSHTPFLILNILQNQNKMIQFDLGAFSIKENIVGTREGIKACQDYGRIFGQKVGS